ncbi:hypothetical protein PAECIP111893_03268 [Paenibacillus plantiphilus]|uniref:Uncharacterized protein n=1 Tax=Paenibacillus plantiphilus TaxID=2905650 RepID=A0ABM9CEP4_9BACL|nr:hypothetical protein PAECIP111893_03268 [Paenibacillus plantiphilus]
MELYRYLHLFVGVWNSTLDISPMVEAPLWANVKRSGSKKYMLPPNSAEAKENSIGAREFSRSSLPISNFTEFLRSTVTMFFERLDKMIDMIETNSPSNFSYRIFSGF